MVPYRVSALVLVVCVLSLGGHAESEQRDQRAGPLEGRESTTVPPVTATMRSLDERIDALSALLDRATTTSGTVVFSAEVHAIETIIAQLDELTQDQQPAPDGEINAKARSTALEQLARNLQTLGQAADSGDLMTLEATYKQIDLRASCQSCHEAYGKTVEFPSQQ